MQDCVCGGFPSCAPASPIDCGVATAMQLLRRANAIRILRAAMTASLFAMGTVPASKVGQAALALVSKQFVSVRIACTQVVCSNHHVLMLSPAHRSPPFIMCASCPTRPRLTSH
eukprot:10261202-Alexandrium_andersonii.AAC.1